MAEPHKPKIAGAFAALLVIDVLLVCGAVAAGVLTGNWMMTGLIIAGGAVILAAIFIAIQAAKNGVQDNAAR